MDALQICPICKYRNRQQHKQTCYTCDKEYEEIVKGSRDGQPQKDDGTD